jgi:hypothetical protein
MSTDQILRDVINEWYEYIEMYPGDEWELIARSLAKRLEKQMGETEYYRRLADAKFRTE